MLETIGHCQQTRRLVDHHQMVVFVYDVEYCQYFKVVKTFFSFESGTSTKC